MRHRTARPILALAASVAFAFLGFSLPAAAADPPGCAADRDACILAAIHELEPGGPGWTKGGKPRVAALEAATGLDISGLERDRAFAEYPAWKERRAELDELAKSLAAMTADRDSQVGEVLRLQERSDALEVELAQAEAELDRTMRASSSATDEARAAVRRADAAEKKLRAVMGGVPVCEAERAVVRADDSWRAKSLRRKVDDLLACLERGES